MAERRMFAKSIIDSDMFLDMPVSTQNLYFHLGMRADDDGFVNSPQKILRMVSCSKNDMDMLIFKNLIIPFETGVCVIKHWRIHNLIRKDRYTETIHTHEKSQLKSDTSKVYSLDNTDILDHDNQWLTNGMTDGSQLVGVGKVRLGKVRVVEGETTPAENPFKLFESEGFGMLSDVIGQKIGDFIDTYGERWVCEAMKEAAFYQKRNLPYVRSILERYKTSGIDEPWRTDGKNKGPKKHVSHHDLPTEAEVRAAEMRKQKELDNLNIEDLM